MLQRPSVEIHPKWLSAGAAGNKQAWCRHRGQPGWVRMRPGTRPGPAPGPGVGRGPPAAAVLARRCRSPHARRGEITAAVNEGSRRSKEAPAGSGGAARGCPAARSTAAPGRGVTGPVAPASGAGVSVATDAQVERREGSARVAVPSSPPMGKAASDLQVGQRYCHSLMGSTQSRNQTLAIPSHRLTAGQLTNLVTLQ